MGLSGSGLSLWILVSLIGLILVTNGSADAISTPPETSENPVGNITNNHPKEVVTEHPVTSSTTEVPKTTPTPSLDPTTTTEHSSRAPEAHSVTPPTTQNPITTTTTQTTTTDKPKEPVIVHLLNATSVLPEQPLPTHILVSVDS